MKTNTMKLISLVLTALLCLGLLAGCQTASAEGGGTGSETLTVGVLQFGTHPSLDNCYAGIEQGMAASGLSYTLDRQDGNFDSATCDTIAKNFVAKQYDLIFAIATPAAVSAYSASQGSDIPVVFCAVSDPVEAGLVDNPEAPGQNCTGTSDLLDLSAQIEMITTIQPDAKTIGVLYTTSEANSISHLRSLKEIVEPMGLTVVEQGVQGAADVPQAAMSLASKVDCINNFTDNNVVSNLQEVLAKAGDAGIPVYGSEIEQVKNGCLASASIDYVALGKETADMAKEILGGADAGALPVRYIKESTPVINSQVAEALGIAIPDVYKDAETV